MFKYETAPYETIIKEGHFEIRSYKRFFTASVQESALSGAGGFNQIFNYISGQNSERKKISMTTPVINEMKDQSMTTEFVMPAEFKGNLPKPSNQNITFKEYEEQPVAVVRFSGSVNKEKIKDYEQKLLQWLEGQAYFPFGSFRLARYNPPFVPPFLRRNEVMIQVKKSFSG